jgi:hypothetical protein
MNLVSELDLPAIYGIDKLPIAWSGSSTVNPNRGLVPYVS